MVGTALFAPPAHAEMSCDEIMMMVDNDYDTSIIVEAIRSTGEVPSSGTIACLEERDVPTPILTLVRELAGETAPPPAASEDESPEEGVSAAPPKTPIDLAPASAPSVSNTITQGFPGTMIVRAATRFAVQCGNGAYQYVSTKASAKTPGNARQTNKPGQMVVVKMNEATECTAIIRGRSADFTGGPGLQVQCALEEATPAQVSCRSGTAAMP